MLDNDIKEFDEDFGPDKPQEGLRNYGADGKEIITNVHEVTTTEIDGKMRTGFFGHVIRFENKEAYDKWVMLQRLEAIAQLI